MDILLQLIVSGIAVGGVYALIALGFVLIYKATSIINFATGEFMMIGAYFFYTFMVMTGLPPIPSFLLVMLCSALLGLFVERAILRHMLGQPTISIVMVTIGLSSILMGLAEMIWSTDFKSFPALFPRAPIIIGDIIVRSNLFWGFVVAMIAVIVFALLFKYAKVGVAMRATAGDQMAAFSMGINVRSMFTVAWAMGAIAAALGGVIIGNIGGIQPTLGNIGLKIFPVVILGGLDSIAGAVVGGFIVGLVENIAGGYLDPYVGGGVKDLAPFVVLVLILFVKPYGLFGKQDIERL
ncbi:MAG: branched-chain amino acid ABC transporter permease [Desulfarculaceae bacterium]|nr:branched-chain amino acid ABC transporter permease [Desulfarculaceae bacterium]MCF8047347.1 branched-chain amino acid ABC transporter permease [Desulfarculaceae bacterium]MCF8064777.1 branched-chain amino acid ABC transporter permease [Desulfarculaceae bacterium]MCF8096574.1 branched-chain amino acid ABC transporter permease [Desulfarculaceae bacterium]MCF8122130.1 branched-chain amino acid ABC transporter permease [Desulfarculaceae bacterium]